VTEAMGEAALSVAKGCGYTNAGTVEFLYEDGSFYYLEMNTRLQVEHPVTELVTGIDLVAQQLRVASGEPLGFSQDDVKIEGHAIEVRINAEDPANGAFLPSPGRITALRPPSGYGTRWDGGYEAGDEISQYYDNLAGKLVCWSQDRTTAINRTVRALEEFVIEGVATTIPADLAILRHPDFAANEHSTKWVENDLDLSGVSATAPAGAAASGDDADGSEGAEEKVRRNVDVEVNGKRFQVSMWVPAAELSVAPAAKAPAKTKRRGSGAAGAGAAGSGQVAVPMQGTVVKVAVEVGQQVDAGDTIIVLEAMKMENNVTADKAGTVSEIRVEAGQSVGGGDVVAVID
jgi:acetyl-CoA/propionyl-CoA carboxylase biotin carboxyl carrier protein